MKVGDGIFGLSFKLSASHQMRLKRKCSCCPSPFPLCDFTIHFPLFFFSCFLSLFPSPSLNHPFPVWSAGIIIDQPGVPCASVSIPIVWRKQGARARHSDPTPGRIVENHRQNAILVPVERLRIPREPQRQ
ncbi:hypothetical protein BDQ94DRAFT_1869 [Aspergillus welwitschiae]|uniref:Uncharacterized protein n=2 Tax=Aspergillus subgen. Circumdati TaxID=2720871 RepID=A0A3F3QKA9_9EURO|nr:uncharacterized protein BO96DRAFT_127983 [Aspergillus niger CBS 101883]XP_026632138.1 hypothetical protein BDQ94DRAFT_1869 [Aspergillus welwitschiae]PYH53435.1 hypothetical protein BO96DRAFT_127983 [Aspergillus niger CBS 101883]RDH15301.1 hypothetical protein M747DRAFT_141090 [Aspergillus niger ATCC 13496]RDH39116.1 hypothetical protein BDQ94DRAFT_1869 [Aspergillus welwitschiae]